MGDADAEADADAPAVVLEGRVLTGTGEELAYGHVVVRGQVIAGVAEGPPDPALAAGARARLGGPHSIVAPGFVNAHTHLFQTYLRGLRDDLDHSEWIGRVIGANSVLLDEVDFHLAAALGAVENLRAGVTTVVENHYVHSHPKNSDEILRALTGSGIRAWFARGTLDDGEAVARAAGRDAAAVNVEPVDVALAELERLAGAWHGAGGGRISVGVATQAAWGSSPELLERLAAQADAGGLLLHAHCAETRATGERCRERHGRDETTVLHDAGYLGPRTQLVHGVWMDGPAVELVAGAGATVVHCPVSNAYLGSGTAPVPELLAAGVPVALAADGSASNHRQDPFESMKSAVLLQRARTLDPAALGPEQVLDMCWRGPARSLGLDGRLGVLAPGALADVIVIDTAGPHLQPMHRTASTLVLCAGPADVTDVVVDGEVVVAQGRVTTVDEAELIARCRARTAALGLHA